MSDNILQSIFSPSARGKLWRTFVLIIILVIIGGMVDAAVDGIILDVRQGSGLVFRCPECNRVLQKNECRVHGEVEGNPDLRTKAVLDDGSGAMTVILNRVISERLLGKSLDKCMKEAKKAMDHSIIHDQLFDKLVAQPVTITSRAAKTPAASRNFAMNADSDRTDLKISGFIVSLFYFFIDFNHITPPSRNKIEPRIKSNLNAC